MRRINLQDNSMTSIIKMSDGNPGAMNALITMLKLTDVDPDNVLGPIGKILLLDTYGIYGTDIYVLYNDICERDVIKMIAVLKATQIGLFDSNLLKDACSRQDYSGKSMVPVDELCNKIKEKFPLFNTYK